MKDQRRGIQNRGHVQQPGEKGITLWELQESSPHPSLLAETLGVQESESQLGRMCHHIVCLVHVCMVHVCIVLVLMVHVCMVHDYIVHVCIVHVLMVHVCMYMCA